ncbi:MAG: glycosyl transferase group 1 [Moraxellaceae bacterium]|jgi:glycosyltransferase involved in cell wall biosynthesis|nr:glycosyl transferase group 1 [Moraxellaceae bacterium]
MKVLTICKRHPQGRDMMTRPYGRFHYLPRALAAAGDQVLQVYLGFPKHEPVTDEIDGVRRVALRMTPASFPALLGQLDRIAADFAPDWVAGLSDSWCGVLAQRVASRAAARTWLDAYDNFEAYMPWNLPLHWLWHRACARADLVTAAGPQLAALLQAHRRSGAVAAVVPMAADPAFGARPRQESRARLGLPPAAPLLGYVGSWTTTRGSHLMLDAFRAIRQQRPDACLVLSGHPPEAVTSEPGVISVGYIDDELLPVLISALDVAAVVTAETRFGSYSYPAKLYEAMACGVPVVATATGPVRFILGEDSAALTPVGDAQAFAARVLAYLERPARDYPLPSSWEEQGRLLRELLMQKAG